MDSLRDRIIRVLDEEATDFPENNNFGATADRILAIPEIDPTPLDVRILAVLGGVRDHMPPEDVAVVQKFARALGELREHAP